MGYELEITEIPKNVKGLRIVLEADVDFDLRLFTPENPSRGTPPGQCLAGYGCEYAAVAPDINDFIYNVTIYVLRSKLISV